MSTKTKRQFHGDVNARPPRPAFNGDAIPDTLKAGPRWVAWRYNWRNGCYTKLPLDAVTGDCLATADTSNPDTWGEFAAVRSAANVARTRDPLSVDGLGRVFCEDDGIFGIDIDSCRDPDFGVLSPLAVDVLRGFATYAEVSPSGMGIKLWGRGSLAEAGLKRGQKAKQPDGQEIEVYDDGRYFTVTGQRIETAGQDVTDCQFALSVLRTQYFPSKDEKKRSKGDASTGRGRAALSDLEVIERITKTAKNAAVGDALWAGSTTAQGGDDSAADLALCNLIAFYTGPDVERIDTIFRASGLMRPKWERSDYRGLTIRKAIEGVQQFYDPRRDDPPAVRIRQDIAPTASRPRVRHALTDRGNGRRLVDLHGADVRYSVAKSCWYIWNGRLWKQDTDLEIRRRASSTIDAMTTEAEDAPTAAHRAAIEQHQIQTQSCRAIANMITAAAAEPGIAMNHDDYDAHPFLFNCPNGTVNLKTGKLQPHDRDDRLTQISPVAYDPAATCPLWELFLTRVFAIDPDEPSPNPNTPLIEYVQKLFGYGLTGSTAEHVMPIFWGGGSNGKTTLVEILGKVFGDDYWCAAPEGMFLAKPTQEHSTELVRLRGKRFLCSAETDEGARLNDSLIKRLTGGDKLVARGMRENFIEFAPTHKVLLCTNARPKIADAGHGMWRRVALVPFRAQFWTDKDKVQGLPHAKADRELPGKLQAELPGILAWLVRGCLAWQRDGLNTLPTEVAEATQEYRDQQDCLQVYVAERIARVPGHQTSAKDLYADYCEWAVENKEKPLGKINFNSRIAGKGFVQARDRNKMLIYEGVRIGRPEPRPSADLDD